MFRFYIVATFIFDNENNSYYILSLIRINFFSRSFSRYFALFLVFGVSKFLAEFFLFILYIYCIHTICFNSTIIFIYAYTHKCVYLRVHRSLDISLIIIRQLTQYFYLPILYTRIITSTNTTRTTTKKKRLNSNSNKMKIKLYYKKIKLKINNIYSTKYKRILLYARLVCICI
jgi:hypothetical protein